ncbi:MAG: hypothetical protein QXO16_08680 [Archaeoglobaceae archaeon]
MNLRVVAILLLVAFVSILAAHAVMNVKREPGILITLNLYDVNIEKKELVDITSAILDDPNVLMYLHIDVIAPPSPKFEDLVTINITMKPKKEIFIRSDELLEISKEWVSVYASRNTNPENMYSGLIIRLIIYNRSTGEIVFEAFDSFSYKPIEVTKGKPIEITMNLVKKSPEQKFKISPVSQHVKSVEAKEICDGCEYWIERELVVSITPESLKTKLPSDYFKSVDGVLYMKTPVLIVKNAYSNSGVITSSINIGMREVSVGVYPTLTSGEILDKITKGYSPTVTLWKGSGLTWGGSTYYFYYNTGDLGPEQSVWIWIWARPVYRIYKVYEVDSCTYTRYYIGDDVENFITHVLTSGTGIVGGGNIGLPQSELMQTLFNGVEMNKLQISGTSLEDGKLDPGESIALEQIVQYFDTCGADFEVGIPAGSLAALSICAVLGLPAGGTACAVAVAFSSAFQLSLSIQGSMYITGGLVNHGEFNGRGYNVPEDVYMAISRYQYKVDPPWWCFWCTPCYYRVPAGIYFQCD